MALARPSRRAPSAESPSGDERGVIIADVSDDATALRVDADEAAGARLRLRLDWRTFVWLTLAVLGALAAHRADVEHDDDAHAHRHRAAHRPRPRSARRLAAAALLHAARHRRRHRGRRHPRPRRAPRPRARAASRRARPGSSPSSCPRRSTSSRSCRSIGGRLRDNEVGERVQDVGARAARPVHRRARRRARQHARQRRRQRRHRDRAGHRRARRRREPARPLPPPAPGEPAAAGRRHRRHHVPHARALLRRLDHGGRPDGPVRADPRPRARHPAGAARRASGRCSPTSSRRSAGSSAARSSCCSPSPRASTPALIAGGRVRALHEPREPRHPAGHRRALRRPDAADDDGRGVRRRRPSPASRARSWRPRSSARPRPSTSRPGASAGPTTTSRRAWSAGFAALLRRGG